MSTPIIYKQLTLTYSSLGQGSERSGGRTRVGPSLRHPNPSADSPPRPPVRPPDRTPGGRTGPRSPPHLCLVRGSCTSVRVDGVTVPSVVNGVVAKTGIFLHDLCFPLETSVRGRIGGFTVRRDWVSFTVWCVHVTCVSVSLSLSVTRSLGLPQCVGALTRLRVFSSLFRDCLGRSPKSLCVPGGGPHLQCTCISCG